jgi:hypothetical protein
MARRSTGPIRPKGTARNGALAVSPGPAAPVRSAKKADDRAAARPPATPQAGPRPATPRPAVTRVVGLRLAAAAQALEALGLAVAGVFAAVSTVDGRSYQVGSGVAATLIALGTAAGLIGITTALALARPWSRIPTVLTQVFVIIVGITLLQGHRPEWGAPALVLAGACLAGLATPAAWRALNRPPVQNQPEPKNPADRQAPAAAPAPRGQRNR